MLKERRKKDREEEEKRMAEQRAAEDARRKAEEVSKPIRFETLKHSNIQLAKCQTTYISAMRV